MPCDLALSQQELTYNALIFTPFVTIKYITDVHFLMQQSLCMYKFPELVNAVDFNNITTNTKANLRCDALGLCLYFSSMA